MTTWLCLVVQAAKGRSKSHTVFTAGFEFTEGDGKRFQWEINEAIGMATNAQVLLPARHLSLLTQCIIHYCAVSSTNFTGCKDCSSEGT